MLKPRFYLTCLMCHLNVIVQHTPGGGGSRGGGVVPPRHATRRYQKEAVEVQRTLGVLNFGQQAIFAVGLSAIMLLTADGIASG